MEVKVFELPQTKRNIIQILVRFEELCTVLELNCTSRTAYLRKFITVKQTDGEYREFSRQ